MNEPQYNLWFESATYWSSLFGGFELNAAGSIIVIAANGDGFEIPPGVQQPFLTLTFSLDDVPDPPEACLAEEFLFLTTGLDSGRQWFFKAHGHI